MELNQKFPIGEYLTANNIVPGGEYTGESIVNVLKPYLNGQSPGLQCDIIHDYSYPVLYQISICFDKKFNIIGCEKSAGGIYGKCNKSGYNKYPKNEVLPSLHRDISKSKRHGEIRITINNYHRDISFGEFSKSKHFFVK